jgi:hypothetical protein
MHAELGWWANAGPKRMVNTTVSQQLTYGERSHGQNTGSTGRAEVSFRL